MLINAWLGFALRRLGSAASAQSALRAKALLALLANLRFLRVWSSRNLEALLQSIVAEVVAVSEGAAHEGLHLFKVVFRSGTPVVDDNRTDIAQGKERGLLHRLLVRAEMLRCEDISVNQSLVRVHPVKDDHSLTLVED